MELIQLGKQDILLAGGSDDMHWSMAGMFDAMGALTSKYNDTPEIASRAYDADRDGFAPGLGAGTVVVEELEHALARGANIICEVTGYGATSDGADMVSPSGEGAERCMKMAMETAARPYRLHQHPRHQHPGRRHCRAGRYSQHLWRQLPGYQLNQITLRPQPGRGRCP